MDTCHRCNEPVWSESGLCMYHAALARAEKLPAKCDSFNADNVSLYLRDIAITDGDDVTAKHLDDIAMEFGHRDHVEREVMDERTYHAYGCFMDFTY